MRTFLIAAWLVFIFSCVIGLFWYNEWVYNLPTPVPKNYTAIPIGSQIRLPALTGAANDKPLFLHFFNPDCPCSRFNIGHVRSLVKQYGGQVNFKLVLVTAKPYTAQEIQQTFNIDIPVLTDTSIATICGVYATPQAVIIDRQQKLYYRGNYNRSRYCADKKFNYAEIALQALLRRHAPGVFDRLAMQAYGCQLPGCAKK